MQFQFATVAEFLAMGGHGPYVWTAFAVTLLVMLALVMAPGMRLRQLRRELTRQQRIAARRRQGEVREAAAAQPVAVD